MNTSIGAYKYRGIIEPIFDTNENSALVTEFLFKVIRTIFSISCKRNFKKARIVNCIPISRISGCI